MNVSNSFPEWLQLPFGFSWISTRNAGDMGPSGWNATAVESRARALESFHIANAPRPEQIASCHQIHSQRILVVRAGRGMEELVTTWDDTGKPRLIRNRVDVPAFSNNNERTVWIGNRDADGILTDIPELWPAVTVADCLPILIRASFPDGTPHMRGVLHSGWAGTGILCAALSFFVEEGCDSISCFLGPCIAAVDYPVPVERADFFATRFGKTAVCVCADGQPGLDLQAANSAILDGSAPCLAENAPWVSLIVPQKPEMTQESTFSATWAHSYRRDGPARYGRMLCITGDYE